MEGRREGWGGREKEGKTASVREIARERESERGIVRDRVVQGYLAHQKQHSLL